MDLSDLSFYTIIGSGNIKNFTMGTMKIFYPNKNTVKLVSPIGQFVMDDLNTPATQQFIDIPPRTRLSLKFNIKLTKQTSFSLNFDFGQPSGENGLVINNITFTKIN